MSQDQNNLEIRKAMVAGSFYQADPAKLTKQLAELFANTKKRNITGHVRAIIAPHAGYIYSGQVAADAFKQVEGENYDTVVVIAPFHHGFFKGVSVYSGDAYETPLGKIEIDREQSDRLSSKHPSVFSSTVGHTGSGGRGEHSLEVQLPFLQLILGQFKLVAMMMGEQEESTIRAASEVLATLRNSNVLLVASTDMSHFYSEKKARQMDKHFEEALKKFDSKEIMDVIARQKSEACGFGPVAAVTEAVKRNGGEKVEIVSYDTSGSASGDFSEVVGYLSAVIVGKKVIKPDRDLIGTPMPKKDAGYTDKEKEYLQKLAREVVEAGASGRKPEPSAAPPPNLEKKRGAFVTLNKQGSLRGCIGLVQARLPLVEAITEMAAAAAFEDPRFPKVTEEELSELEYEISVMSPLSTVDDFSEIEVGRHGLMVRLDLHSGLLLPQVAAEYKWDRITFLEQTCLKAGLPKNSYKDKRAQIYKFSVEKF